MNNKDFASLAMIGSALCWGGSLSLSKEALTSFSSSTLLSLQLLSSVCFLWIIELYFFRFQFIKFRAYAGLGVIEPGLSYLLGIIGLGLSSVSHASILGATEPLFVLPLAYLILREKVNLSMVQWIILGMVGVFCVIGISTLFSLQDAALGDLLILLGMLSAATYVVFSKRTICSDPSLVMARQQQSVGLILLLAITYVFDGNSSIEQLLNAPTQMLFVVFISGIIQYALAFWLYLYAIRTLSANLAASFLNLIPIFGVISACIFLEETITTYTLIGAAATIYSANRLRLVM